jgi:hypothetical protein
VRAFWMAEWNLTTLIAVAALILAIICTVKVF